jgi:hypothetical protein
MKSFAQSVAPVAWLVTLPQLISRVSHTNADVTSVLNVSIRPAMLMLSPAREAGSHLGYVVEVGGWECEGGISEVR